MPATITVTTTSDAVAVDGVVSLREAILSINAGRDINADVKGGLYGDNDTIVFKITDGSQVIKVAVANGALPALNNPVRIDGAAQGIQIDGSLFPNANKIDGLSASASNVFILNLTVENFTGNGISITGTGNNDTIRSCLIASNKGNGVYLKGGNTDFVEGCNIGTDSKATDLGNGGFGVVIEGGTGDDIGWEPKGFVAAADHNFISRNKAGGIEITGAAAQNNVVANNDIGAGDNYDDTTGNGGMGVYLTDFASHNTIGVNVANNVTTGARNVIAGNAGAGVIIDRNAHDNQVAGNYIGIRDGGNRAGQVVGNQGYGVEIQSLPGLDNNPPQNNTIGGLPWLSRTSSRGTRRRASTSTDRRPRTR